MLSDFFGSILLFVAGGLDSGLFPTIKGPNTTTAYCTNADLTLKLSAIKGPSRGPAPSGIKGKTWQLSVDDSPAGHKQVISGFGATVTDATVITFNSLSSTKLDSLLSSLMTSSGADFNIMRHTVGSSDLSPVPAVTYDDNKGQPDTDLEAFALGSQGTSMARLLASMKAKNSEMTVVGTSWSPPAWMKENGVLFGNVDDNNLKNDYLVSGQTSYAAQFAQYFVKYIRAFATEGVTVDAITLQNEPLLSATDYPTMYMYDYEQGHLIQDHVGPALSDAGLATSVWAYDHNTDKPSYPQNVLSIASNYTNTVCWHCYASNLDWSVLSDFHEKNPNITQYMSECWTPSVGASDWYQAANFTIGPLQNWAVGIISWGLGSDESNGPYLPGGCDTCRGLVTINDDKSYKFNIAYYLMAQFSKFMPRGAIVLDGTGSSENRTAPGIQSVATLNPDKTKTVVIMNTFENNVYLTLNTTSGEQWSGNVLASSVVTWILPAS